MAYVPTPALAPHATATLTYAWGAVEGTHELLDFADAFGKIEEFDEANNGLAAAILVLPPPPDVAIEIAGIRLAGEGLRARSRTASWTFRSATWALAPLAVRGDATLSPSERAIGEAELPTLPAGACASLTFRWDSTGSAGTLVFTARTATERDNNAANDSAEANHDVIAAGPGYVSPA